jgi:hypothetical protein
VGWRTGARGSTSQAERPFGSAITLRQGLSMPTRSCACGRTASTLKKLPSGQPIEIALADLPGILRTVHEGLGPPPSARRFKASFPHQAVGHSPRSDSRRGPGSQNRRGSGHQCTTGGYQWPARSVPVTKSVRGCGVNRAPSGSRRSLRRRSGSASLVSTGRCGGARPGPCERTGVLTAARRIRTGFRTCCPGTPSPGPGCGPCGGIDRPSS